ncbi:hypothetical protein JX266_000619 [Neoarthrinium moseri]|nr:hypothetical protein JX266_000619 [Neoarthrinium moseri]
MQPCSSSPHDSDPPTLGLCTPSAPRAAAHQKAVWLRACARASHLHAIQSRPTAKAISSISGPGRAHRNRYTITQANQHPGDQTQAYSESSPIITKHEHCLRPGPSHSTPDRLRPLPPFPRSPVPPSRYPVPVTPELWPEPGRARSTTNQSKNHLASHTDDRSRHTALPPPSREDAPALPHADRSQDSLPSGTYKQDKIGAAYTYMRYMR